MTEIAAKRAILDLLVAAFDALSPSLPFCVDNQNFDPAVDALGSPYWARVSILMTTSRRRSIGSPARVTRNGNVFVQTFVPQGSGTGDRPDDTAGVDTLTATIRTALELVSEAELDIDVGGNPRGRLDGPWWMTTLVFPFSFTDYV